MAPIYLINYYSGIGARFSAVHISQLSLIHI